MRRREINGGAHERGVSFARARRPVGIALLDLVHRGIDDQERENLAIGQHGAVQADVQRLPHRVRAVGGQQHAHG
jgi:hypothetical protein